MRGGWLLDLQDQLFGRRVGHVRVGRDLEAGNNRVAIEVRVVDVELSVDGELRMERNVEKPLLSATAHLVRNIEKEFVDQLLTVVHNDPPRLQHDEQPA